jgi:hypothetical protein
MEESSNGGFVSLSNFNDSLPSLMSNLPIFNQLRQVFNHLIVTKNYSEKSIKKQDY